MAPSIWQPDYPKTGLVALRHQVTLSLLLLLRGNYRTIFR